MARQNHKTAHLSAKEWKRKHYREDYPFSVFAFTTIGLLAIVCYLVGDYLVRLINGSSL